MAILEGKEAILEVARHVDVVDESTSSHWRIESAGDRIHPLKQNPFELAYGDEGFRSIGPIGSVSTKAGFPYETVHRLLQAPIRWQGRNFGQFPAIERAARTVVRRQGRAYDKDVLRHALTLGLLCEHVPLEQETDPIAIIGDGFANMASMILAHLPGSRVILVNLTKTLLVDLAFLYQAFPEIGYCYVDNAGSLKEALAREELRVVAVRADDAEILSEAPISLAINILSMMEIDPPITARYFDILRRAPRAETAFYCCNRVEKTLPDGTVTRFFEYPWNPDDQILVDQPCPWTAIAYRGRPPFYYRGPKVFHRLVMLKKL